jgi:hypothetical protein
MTNRMEMPRKRGSMVGTLLLIAGIWGALIPFVGPYFDWVIGPDNAFDMTEGRFWLSLVPGLAVIAGALILTGAANRISGGVGAWLALAGGAWFVVGATVSRLINDGASWAGEPMGGASKQAFETLTYFEGLGALIVALAAFALGRMTIRDHRDHDLDANVADHDQVADREPRTERERSGRFTREPAREQAPVAATGVTRDSVEDRGRTRDRPIL